MNDFRSPFSAEDLLQQMRSEFDRIRTECGQVSVQIVHKATNAEAEGVVGVPFEKNQMVSFSGAGHKYGGPICDSNGNLTFRDDPILDVHGNPIINTAGDAINFQMPVFRTVQFSGAVPDYRRIHACALRLGKVIAKIQHLDCLRVLSGWNFSDSDDLWWSFIFELAWSGKHPLLHAEKQLWLPDENPRTFIPYDIEDLRGMVNSRFLGEHIPAGWLKRLPEAYMSKISDVAVASCDAIDFLLASIRNALQENESKNRSGQSITMSDKNQVSIQRRFRVALSFPGEYRTTIEQVAKTLRESLGEGKVLYDKFLEAELAIPNSDIYLQNLYREDSELIVVFVCKAYQDKPWCGLEWDAIRSLMNLGDRADHSFMFMRFDDGKVDGLLPTTGYVDVRDRNPLEIAMLIMSRVLPVDSSSPGAIDQA